MVQSVLIHFLAITQLTKLANFFQFFCTSVSYDCDFLINFLYYYSSDLLSKPELICGWSSAVIECWVMNLLGR